MISSFSFAPMREVAEAHRAGRRQRARGSSRPRRARWPGSARRDRCAPRAARVGNRPGSGGGEERVERDPLERIGRERSERLLGAGAAGDACALASARCDVQHLRRVLERLAVEEPGEQEVALLEPGQLLVEIDVVAAGKQAARLQLDERRRDQQELGGRLEIDPLHPLDLGAERVDDARERDLPEIDLFLEDQMQQEIERALENRRRDLVGHGGQGIQRGRGFDAPRRPRKAPGDRGSRR